jgi:predicted DNA-binding protein
MSKDADAVDLEELAEVVPEAPPGNREIAQTSIYLNAEDRKMVKELQERTGLARSAVVRHAIRRVYYGEEADRRTRLIAIAEEIKKLA